MIIQFAFGMVTFFSSILLLRSVKALRGQRGALSQKICLDDLMLLLVPAMAVVVAHSIDLPVLATLLQMSLMLYGLLVWLDAVLFVQYRIEINRQTLAWFFTGSKGLAKGVPHLLSLFKRFPITLLIVPVWFAVAISTVAAQQPPVTGLLASAVVAAMCVFRISAGRVECVLTAAVLIAFAVIPATWPVSLPMATIQAMGGVFILTCGLLVALIVVRKVRVTQHEFFTAPTLLANLVGDDSFQSPGAFEARDEHKPYIDVSYPKQRKSQYFGQCKRANIILITMESLGCYVNPYVTNGARSRIAQRMQANAWVSRQHFSLCPNTTVSTNQMYTGHYSNNPYNKPDSVFPGKSPRHVSHLKQHGYKTLFLDSADIGLYDYHRLLSRIGFDRVWGTNDIPGHGLKGDYRLWNMVEDVVKEVGNSPFFLHVINDQTHMPYEVIDKQKFNRHTGNSQKALYLNAVEEVDYIFDEFLRRLGEKLDMSNTLLVFTGDHGESFGEFGYSFHSNSVITPQIQVPFLMSHPALQARTIEHSCHFDLFPTFFDLLGIEYDYDALGSSVGIDDREFAYFAHSATLKGNSPANFGFIRNGELLWMDRLFNQVSLLSQQQVRKSLNASEQAYTKSMLHKMLAARGVLQ